MIGTSHPRDISLADCEVPILKIYGSKDGIAEEKSILANKIKLPKTAKFVRIDGANHSQFGYYGFQFGDNGSDLSREQQQTETFIKVLEFIKE